MHIIFIHKLQAKLQGILIGKGTTAMPVEFERLPVFLHQQI